MWIPRLCNVHILLIFYSFRCWSVLLFVCTLKAVKRNVMVHFTVHLRLMLLVRLYCFRRVCVGWHYRDRRFCHSALVVLDGVHMRMKSIDSSLLALWRLIHNLGLPHTCVRARCDKHAHTHTNSDTEACALCWHLTFYRKRSGDQLTRSCCQSRSIRPPLHPSPLHFRPVNIH